MKRRRNLLLVLLLISALAIGVGYAAISDILYIDGTITATEQQFEVVFTQYTPDTNAAAGDFVGTSTGVSSSITGTIEGNTTAKLNITGFSVVGDQATGTFTIQNRNDVTMYVTMEPVIKCGDVPTDLSSKTPNGTDDGCENFDLVYQWENTTPGQTEIELAPNATAEFTMTVSLDKIPAELGTDLSTLHHYFGVSILASAVDPTPTP